MATAIIQAPRACANDAFPLDYFDLVDELKACTTKEKMREWTLGTTARRAALPREAQNRLRELTIAQFELVRGGTPVEPVDDRAVAAERDIDRLARTRARLIVALGTCSGDVTPSEYEEISSAVSCACRICAADAIDALGIAPWFAAVANAEREVRHAR